MGFEVTPAATSCQSLKAVVPVIGQEIVSVSAASTSGTTAQVLLPEPVSGSVAKSAGFIQNDLCADLEVSVVYVGGADCNECTLDTLVFDATTTKKVIVPAGAKMHLPSGLIASAEFVTGTYSAGVFTPANITKTGKVFWYSEYQPGCDGAIVLVP